MKPESLGCTTSCFPCKVFYEHSAFVDTKQQIKMSGDIVSGIAETNPGRFFAWCYHPETRWLIVSELFETRNEAAKEQDNMLRYLDMGIDELESGKKGDCGREFPGFAKEKPDQRVAVGGCTIQTMPDGRTFAWCTMYNWRILGEVRIGFEEAYADMREMMERTSC
jgi:hypothetical protein